MRIFNFKKAKVTVFENRLEIEHRGIGNLFMKGHAGTIIINLKHLETIFFTKDVRLEFVTAGMPHSENMFLACQRENQIHLTKKDAEKVNELMNMLREML